MDDNRFPELINCYDQFIFIPSPDFFGVVVVPFNIFLVSRGWF
jgi:hypothetical protein